MVDSGRLIVQVLFPAKVGVSTPVSVPLMVE
jgi:hypothetical protein